MPSLTWNGLRGEQRRRQRQTPRAAMTMNEPMWNAPLSAIPSACREPPPRPVGGDSKDGSGPATASDNPTGVVRGRSPSRPEDERSAKQLRTDDPMPPDPGGAQASPAGIPLPSTPVAISSSAVDVPGAKISERPTRPRSLGLPLGNATIGESPRTPQPKRTRVIGMRWTTSTWLQQSRRSWKITRSRSWIGRPWLPAITWARRGSCAVTECAWCTCNTCRGTECTKSLTSRQGSSRCRCVGWTKTTTARPKRDSLSEARSRS